METLVSMFSKFVTIIILLKQMLLFSILNFLFRRTLFYIVDFVLFHMLVPVNILFQYYLIIISMLGCPSNLVVITLL